jgi:hypothetical protein
MFAHVLCIDCLKTVYACIRTCSLHRLSSLCLGGRGGGHHLCDLYLHQLARPLLPSRPPGLMFANRDLIPHVLRMCCECVANVWLMCCYSASISSRCTCTPRSTRWRASYYAMLWEARTSGSTSSFRTTTRACARSCRMPIAPSTSSATGRSSRSLLVSLPPRFSPSVSSLCNLGPSCPPLSLRLFLLSPCVSWASLLASLPCGPAVLRHWQHISNTHVSSSSYAIHASLPCGPSVQL